MRALKILLKTFAALIIVSALFAAGAAVLVKMRWKPTVERFLSDALGVGIKFEGAALNPKEYALTIRGLKILSGGEFERNTFYGERCTLMLDKDLYDEEERLFVKEVVIEGGELSLERNEKGRWNIERAELPEADFGPGAAYAAESEGGAPLYTFVKSIKKVSIRDSGILFKDKYVPGGPFEMAFYDFDFKLDSEEEFESVYGYIPIKVEADFNIENSLNRDSKISVKGKIAAYPGSAAMDMTVIASYVDLMQFLPYFESYTPFSFNSGLFSSTTELSIRDNMIDCSTTMLFHKLNLLIDKGMENAQFLETSVNNLAPYLMSRGEILFDFVVKGPVDNPKANVGPKVKSAMTALFMDGIGKALQ
ncbi:MAG: DUF748 domain-containing protein [Candidatus Omnitrophica bacterium]|nr:DUF748 domain-containing protein [Candidatus Omnitrophota bacterium]